MNEADVTPWAGQEVIDCHFHERATDEGLIAHLDGAGVSGALVLAFGDFTARHASLAQTHPGRILGWARGAKIVPSDVDPEGDGTSAAFDMTSETTPDAVTQLRQLKLGGWKGFAETGGPLEVDSPELQRAYALAGELDVPVMMHFQATAAPGQPAYGIRGFSRIEDMLKKYPRTRFVAHAPDFWGGIDARYRDGGMYLLDAVVPGGLSDRLLADYDNLYGDLGAPSALLQLRRDLDFTTAFLERHRSKLMFGSDCGCADGQGTPPDAPAWPVATGAAPADAGAGRPAAAGSAAGDADRPAPEPKFDAQMAAAMQTAMMALGGLAGKCIARELLDVVWRTTSPETFHDLVSANARRVYALDS
ncbi:hypothetical protein GCM10017594_03720 [Microbacterium terrae]|nr:hypothetical protein GCM10017594_03720 [Microbacterium terrae]